MNSNNLEQRLFTIENTEDFETLALDIFQFQYENTLPYRRFCQAISRFPKDISKLVDIPFLPIQFFKSQKVITKNHSQIQQIFTSSGTTGQTPSKHYIHKTKLYEKTFKNAFTQFYGNIEDFVVLALLPSYLERQGSSLIYMAEDFIQKSRHPESGFYLNDYQRLAEKLIDLDQKGEKVLLIGVSFALLDLIERQHFHLKNTIIMETGGMKGRRKEMTRFELHDHLKSGFGVDKIHSEYGMTELLSQAYSQGDGKFNPPSTMAVLIREPEDPFQIQNNNKTGGLNIIDLANIYSCSFIATQDLGKKSTDGRFEVLGRFDHSDIRGCNLLLL